MLALKEIDNLQNRESVGGDGDFRRLIDLLERSWMGHRASKLGLGRNTRGNFGDCLSCGPRRARFLRGYLFLGLALLGLVYGEEIVVPPLSHFVVRSLDGSEARGIFQNLRNSWDTSALPTSTTY